MAADRRVDAARPAQAALGLGGGDLLVERLAHAVQALELVLRRVPARRPRHLVHGGQRVRVVRRELRVDLGRRGEQAPRAGEVGDVGVRLAGVDGVVGQTRLLRALDLGVPVGALDEAHHQPVAAAPRQVDQPLDHLRAALLVGLHDEAQAVPAGERRLQAQPLEQVERDLQPVGLLGVDVEADVVRHRLGGQPGQPRVELVHHPVALRAGVARMQRRQLDRDARPLDRPAAGCRAADGVDGVLVGVQVGARVLVGERRLAEHVVRVAERQRPRRVAGCGGVAADAAAEARARVGERLLDRLAVDELRAHQAHRAVDGGADQRLAAPRHAARQRLQQPALVVRRDQPAGDDQPPGGGVDEQRAAVAEVRLPVAVAQLVADQRVARRRVGDAQQRLGQAHQRHALLRRQRELPHQPLHQPLAAARQRALAQPRRQPPRQPVRVARLLGRQPRGVEQRRDRLGLGAAGGGPDGGAQGRGGGGAAFGAGETGERHGRGGGGRGIVEDTGHVWGRSWAGGRRTTIGNPSGRCRAVTHGSGRTAAPARPHAGSAPRGPVRRLRSPATAHRHAPHRRGPHLPQARSPARLHGGGQPRARGRAAGGERGQRAPRAALAGGRRCAARCSATRAAASTRPTRRTCSRRSRARC